MMKEQLEAIRTAALWKPSPSTKAAAELDGPAGEVPGQKGRAHRRPQA